MAAGIRAVVNGYLGDRSLSLSQDTIVDAMLINAPSSTKNKGGKRDLQMHQTKRGNQYYLGAKAHIGVDDVALVHSVVVTAANVADVDRGRQVCCTVRRTWSMSLQAIPASRSGPSTTAGK